MKLTLVCVRHGEAEHNLATPTSISAPRWTEEGNLDTPLTPRGREQAEQVVKNMNFKRLALLIFFSQALDHSVF